MVEQAATRRRIPIVKTAAVVILEGGKVLGVRHGYNTTLGEGVRGLPGGRLEKGETKKQAAVRELWQETGLVTEPRYLRPFPGNYFRKRMRFNGGAADASLTVYVCTSFSGELRPEPVGDTAPEWIKLREFYLHNETGPNQPQVVYNAEIFLVNGGLKR